MMRGILFKQFAAFAFTVALFFHAWAQVPSRTDFEIIEGRFHDGLGTFAELMLANEIIFISRIDQPRFDTSTSEAKMNDAIRRLPDRSEPRLVFEREIANIKSAARSGAAVLVETIKPARLLRVRHTAREYSGARAGDISLECEGRAPIAVSVKTDKSGKVAVAEGQTPDIAGKWAERYFRVSPSEFEVMMKELGFSNVIEMKSNYLNVARLVAHVLIVKLGLEACRPADFSRARVTNIEAAKYLFHQLLKFKRGRDDSRVIIFDRKTGEVKWESALDGIDIDRLSADRISFLPSRPRRGHPIASEFGIKIDSRTVVSFQVKHRRGAARATDRQHEFSDITTRLRIQ